MNSNLPPTPIELLHRLSRRTALATAGVFGLGAVSAACGAGTTKTAGGSSSTTTPSTSTPSTSGTGSTISSTSSTATTAVETAATIWHADTDGLYSGFVSSSASANGGGSSSPADDGTFLRGTQLTDANGQVTFETLYPGWYRGRTVHIHVMVHVSGSIVHTGQLFFDDTFTGTVYDSTAPYSSRAARDTRNANDGIYSGGGSASILPVSTTAPYIAALTMGIKH